MAGSLRNDVDVSMSAHSEQVETWHEALRQSGHDVTLREVVNILIRSDGVQREAIMKLAAEIDELRASQSRIAAAWQTAIGTEESAES
jgi:hypothetical protein